MIKSEVQKCSKLGDRVVEEGGDLRWSVWFQI